MTDTSASSLVPLADVSVVIPVFKDWGLLQVLLNDLSNAIFGEIIIAHCDPIPDVIYSDPRIKSTLTQRSRGLQIDEAMKVATKEWIWIVHADSRVSHNSLKQLASSLGHCDWGAFRVKVKSMHRSLKLVSWLMNIRSRATSIFTGDQGIFARRQLMVRAGGCPRIPLMEDIALSRRLKVISRGFQIDAVLETSARKWERDGVLVTVCRMWWYRLRYLLGAKPHQLANLYYRTNEFTL